VHKEQPINFRSDNVAAAAPEVLAGLAQLGRAAAGPYGDDEETRALPASLMATFGRLCVGWPLPTGTAANAMTIGALLPEGGTVICHERAHAFRSEEGATVHANPAITFLPLPGEDGRIERVSLQKAIGGLRGPAALTLTQANEFGCAYDLDALSTLGGLAHHHGVRVHIDGARLGPACRALGVSPQDVVAAARPDALSLGLTKAGTIDTDAAVFFSDSLPARWSATLRRSGFLVSKARYQSNQIRTLLEDGLWLRLADRSVEMANRLRRGLEQSPAVVSVRPSQSNLLLVEFTSAVQAELASSRFLVKRWQDPPWLRLVTSFATTPSEVDTLLGWLSQRQS
jgi:threonine aldolase